MSPNITIYSNPPVPQVYPVPTFSITIKTQFRSVTVQANRPAISVAIAGRQGAASTVPGPIGLSAYQVAVNNGFIGSELQWIESLKGDTGADSHVQGPSGLSAYQIALNNGFSGSASDWLASLKGTKGADSTVPGPTGLSAYQIAVNNGFVGSESAWLASLVGASSLVFGHIVIGNNNGSGLPDEETQAKIDTLLASGVNVKDICWMDLNLIIFTLPVFTVTPLVGGIALSVGLAGSMSMPVFTPQVTFSVPAVVGVSVVTNTFAFDETTGTAPDSSFFSTYTASSGTVATNGSGQLRINGTAVSSVAALRNKDGLDMSKSITLKFKFSVPTLSTTWGTIDLFEIVGAASLPANTDAYYPPVLRVMFQEISGGKYIKFSYYDAANTAYHYNRNTGAWWTTSDTTTPATTSLAVSLSTYYWFYMENTDTQVRLTIKDAADSSVLMQTPWTNKSIMKAFANPGFWFTGDDYTSVVADVLIDSFTQTRET